MKRVDSVISPTYYILCQKLKKAQTETGISALLKLLQYDQSRDFPAGYLMMTRNYKFTRKHINKATVNHNNEHLEQTIFFEKHGRI